MASAPATVGAKICVACGENVEGKKRMKDSQGKYWCYACGVADQQKKTSDTLSGTVAGSGAEVPADAKRSKMSQCPNCRGFFPPVDMIRSERFKGKYVCTRCHTKSKGKAKGKGRSTGRGSGGMDPEKTKKYMLIGVAVVVLVLVSLYFNGMLPI